MESGKKICGKLRRGAHILRTLKCKYCKRNFYGCVRDFKQHVRNHERKYCKYWRRKKASHKGLKCQKATDDLKIKAADQKDVDGLGLDSKQHVKERFIVYIVYAPKNVCECDKENQPLKMPCKCDIMYKKMVYSSIAQMHRHFSKGVSYKCHKCKKEVVPQQVNTNVTGAIVCIKCRDSFSTKQDLEVHEQVCLGFKKDGHMFKCLQCNTQLSHHKDMVLHTSILHSEDSNATGSENICFCGQRSVSSTHVKAHLQSHPEYAKTGLVCSVCGWQCSDTSMLEQHSKSHIEKNQNMKNKTKENKTSSKQMRASSGGKRKTDVEYDNDYVPEMAKYKNKSNSKKRQKERPVQLNSGMRLRPRKQLKPNIYIDDAQWETELESNLFPDLQYECNYCERAFTSTEYLQNHKRTTHFGQTPYLCLMCKRRFSDQALFKLHREMHNETFQCTFCKATFDKLELLHNHDQAHGSDKLPSYKCSECSMVFPNAQGLYKHLQTHSNDESGALQSKQNKLQTEKQSRKVSKPTRYPCSSCEKTFPTQSALKIHEKSHKSDTVYPCKYCSKEFKFESDHKIHESLHEEYDGLAPEAHKYKCKYCRKGLQHKTDLKLHEALHEAHGRKDFPCDQCDKVFKHRLEMKQHRRNHFRDKLPKPTKCPDCDKTYIWGTQLREHKKTHWSEKPFLCVYCQVRFKTQEELDQHEPEHTKNKRHQCHICNRRFKDKAHIRDHMLIHTGEKPFPCRYCPKSFRQLGQRRTHERVHTREAPFICEICNRAFIYWTSLRVHKKSHYKGKPPEEVEKLIRNTKIIAKKKAPSNKQNKQEASSADQTSSENQQPVAVEQQPPQQVSAIVSTNVQQQHQETSNHEELPGTQLPHIQPPVPQNIRQNMNMPIHLTIQSNEQMQSVDHMTSQLQRPEELHQPPGAPEAHWETLHTRYLNNPQTWQPPPNWQSLPTTQPMQNPTNWEMPPGNWAGPPPAHQSHTSASSIITSALYGIMQRDNDGRGYQQ